MAVERNAKALASRLDPGYINRARRSRWVRRIAIFVCCAVGLTIWGTHFGRGDQTPFSPGPLTSAHAMWDGNRCGWCHESDPGGGFFKTVSDTACLRCHDAAIHHPNQTTLVSLNGDSTPARSANCTSCHQEHKTHERLISRSNTTCVQCHEDLAPKTRDHSPAVAPRVTAFAVGAHPPLGRSLTTEKRWSASPQPLNDPTPLRFNHARHQTEVKPLPGETANCTQCHRPGAESAGGAKYLATVSYQRDCATCHRLGIDEKSLLVVPHQSMDIVRLAMKGIASDPATPLRAALDRLPESERKTALTKVQRVKKSSFSSEMVTKTVTLTPEQWVQDAVKTLSGKFPGANDGQLDPGALEAAIVRQARNGGNNYGCVLCHDLSDSPTAGRLRELAGPPMNASTIERIRSTPMPATAPAQTMPAENAAVETLPTGLGGPPRRWYVHSDFDHRAHRAASCLECHGQAKTSTDTKDVLLPALESCVRCHAPKASDGSGGAETSCLACHRYHETGASRSMNGTFKDQDLFGSTPPRN